MVLAKRIIRGRSDAVSTLPMCASDTVPPRPTRQFSDGAVAHQHMPNRDGRNLSISTSAPSIYENYMVSRTRDSVSSHWISPMSSTQSSTYVTSVDPFNGGLLGRGFANGRRNQRKTSDVPNLAMFLGLTLFFLPWIGQKATVYQYTKLADTMIALKVEHQGILDSFDKKAKRVSTLEETLRQLERENHRMLADLHMSGEVFMPEDSNYQEMGKIESALIARLDTLRSRIQKNSKMRVEDKYGRGPHHVEVTLREGSDPVLSENNKFVIELAPLNVMPHAVHHFLEMVSRGLWDGLSFVHRDLHSHVLQATPLDVQKAERVDARFYEANLAKLAFSEYSADYPHKAYTVGFAGRPGGPDFYVNTVDNTESHGPMDNHEVDEGESCFGTVISGRDVLDNLLLGEEDTAKIKLVEIDTIRLMK